MNAVCSIEEYIATNRGLNGFPSFAAMQDYVKEAMLEIQSGPPCAPSPIFSEEEKGEIDNVEMSKAMGFKKPGTAAMLMDLGDTMARDPLAYMAIVLNSATAGEAFLRQMELARCDVRSPEFIDLLNSKTMRGGVFARG